MAPLLNLVVAQTSHSVYAPAIRIPYRHVNLSSHCDMVATSISRLAIDVDRPPLNAAHDMFSKPQRRQVVFLNTITKLS